MRVFLSPFLLAVKALLSVSVIFNKPFPMVLCAAAALAIGRAAHTLIRVIPRRLKFLVAIPASFFFHTDTFRRFTYSAKTRPAEEVGGDDGGTAAERKKADLNRMGKSSRSAARVIPENYPCGMRRLQATLSAYVAVNILALAVNSRYILRI